jgi:hypothetical protein
MLPKALDKAMMVPGSTGRGGEKMKARNEEESEESYDMIDDASDFSRPDPLGPILGYLSSYLAEEFQKYDGISWRNQEKHKFSSTIAIGCGSAAVIIAELQLLMQSAYLTFLELAILFLLIITLGAILWRFYLNKWLLDRHIAEQYRLLKFRFLIDPILWCPNSGPTRDGHFEKAKKDLGDRISDIEQRAHRPLDDCAVSEATFPIAPEFPDCPLLIHNLTPLLDYYTEKRLKFQISYFKNRLESFEKTDKQTKWITNTLILMSIVFALIHVVIDLVLIDAWKWQNIFLPQVSFPQVSTWSIFLSITSAILVASFRTWRSSTEVGRNAVFFRAKYLALQDFSRRMKDEIERKSPDVIAVMKLLWECENFLEEENHEWLRIMIEAEKF